MRNLPLDAMDIEIDFGSLSGPPIKMQESTLHKTCIFGLQCTGTSLLIGKKTGIRIFFVNQTFLGFVKGFCMSKITNKHHREVFYAKKRNPITVDLKIFGLDKNLYR